MGTKSETQTIHIQQNGDAVKAGKDAEFLDKLENAILHVAGLSGTYYRGPWHEDWIHTPGRNTDIDSTTVVPPNELRHWYFLNQDEQYLSSGKFAANQFRKAYETHMGALRPGDHIMEVGCSAGRLIRWFQPEAEAGAFVWGADIDAAAIMWAQANLHKSLRFFTNTTAPSLPFPDRTLNLLFGNSLFTHIGELAENWMLEVGRALSRDRGLAVITFNDERTMKKMLDENEESGTTKFRTADRARQLADDMAEDGVAFGKLVFNSSPWQQSVWYSNAYLERHLSQYFRIVEIIPKIGGYQTGFVLAPLF